MAFILLETLLENERLLFRYRQNADQQAETRRYYAEKAEKKRLKLSSRKNVGAKTA